MCINPKLFRFRKDVVMGICGVGIPASIQNLLNVTGMTVLNNFTSSFGADAVAAMGISQKLNMVPMNIAFGFTQGVMPLISYNYASGNGKRMKSTIVFSGKSTISFLVLISAFYYFGAGFWMRLFIQNESIVAYGTRFLHGMCLGLPFLCMDFLAVGVFQACGMGSKALVFAILRKIVLEIPALYLLNRIWPLYGLAYAQTTAEVVLCFAALSVLFRLFRRLEARSESS